MTIDSSALDQVRWNDQGLVPAIAQDATNGDVLMMAWMNREALRATIEEGRAVYWSRSRQSLWRKGESSGNTQYVKDLRLDCDKDTLLISVQQEGGIACHTGRRHCFMHRLKEGQWTESEPVVKDPSELYSGS